MKEGLSSEPDQGRRSFADEQLVCVRLELGDASERWGPIFTWPRCWDLQGNENTLCAVPQKKPCRPRGSQKREALRSGSRKTKPGKIR